MNLVATHLHALVVGEGNIPLCITITAYLTREGVGSLCNLLGQKTKYACSKSVEKYVRRGGGVQLALCTPLVVNSQWLKYGA